MGDVVALRALLDRYSGAIKTRDWDALRSVYAPDMRLVDRRLIGWGESEGPDAVVETLRGWIELAGDVDQTSEPIALGASAGVIRQLWRGHIDQSGGPAEIEMLNLVLVRGGVCSRVEIFDGTDVEAVLSRFEEIGAQTEPERVLARVCRIVNSRDWNALEELYTVDYERIDHRMLGWEPLRGGRAMADFLRSWVDLVPDGELRFAVLASDDEHAVVRLVGWGHAAEREGGGEMEYPTTQFVSFRDGRFRRAELFDDEALALARFQELRADRL